MIRGMFVTFAMEQSRRDDYDTDASLEYSEDEMRQQFLDFYDDVLPEFRNAGKVVQFKVIKNLLLPIFKTLTLVKCKTLLMSGDKLFLVF